MTAVLFMSLASTYGKPRLSHLSTIKDARRGKFSHDSKVLVLIGKDHADVVDTLSSRRLYRITRNDSVILGADFSPDGRILATAEKTLDNSQTQRFRVTLWDAATGKENLSPPVIEDVWYRIIDDVSFSSDGSLLASNLGGIPRLWRTKDGTEERRFLPTEDKYLLSIRVLLSPDGNLLAVYFKKQNPPTDIIRIWNLASQKQIDIAVDVYRDWAFSADSKLLVVTATERKGFADEHAAAEVWDTTNGRRLKTIETPKEWRGAYVVAVSADSSMIAIGGYKKFGLFSVQSGELLASVTHPKLRLFQDNEMGNELSDIEFSPDGKMLLTGGEDGTVKLWRIER